MPIDAIVRASFQSHVKGNQAVNRALVGHAQDAVGTGPFERVNTQVFVASAKPDADIHAALDSLIEAIGAHSSKLDYLSLTVTTRKPQKAQKPPKTKKTPTK
tara:strand:- start:7 stop:312 length:306 start_codon:yes stop_codon:yes gene_type:complete